MKQFIANALSNIASYFGKSTNTQVNSQVFSSSGGQGIDAYRRVKEPGSNDLTAELKNMAYACVTINSSACAASPPKLYIRTRKNEKAQTRYETRSLPPHHPLVVQQKSLGPKTGLVEEVLDHPINTLFASVNPFHNSQDLWELTTLHQEVYGSCYWHLESGPFNTPEKIWILQPQNIKPIRNENSSNLIDAYEYKNGNHVQIFKTTEIIRFAYPDPKDPYFGALSPLKASFEHIALASQFLAFKRSVWDNRAMPSGIVSPKEVIGEEERDRLEIQWNQKFARGGNGKILFADSPLNLQTIQSQLGDMTALAEAGATREDIANAFGIPISFISSETNLANLEAAEQQHAKKTILPKLKRRDEKLNEQLIPLYDKSGRLFFKSDDPTPEIKGDKRAQEKQDLELGVKTINDVRLERGLSPVEWGDKPYSRPVTQTIQTDDLDKQNGKE